jgi:2'-5' RNA ligase
MQVEGLRLPPAPSRVRVFAADDLHLTLCFFGAVQEVDARRAWGGLGRFRSLRPVEGTFERLQPLGNPRKPSALTAIVAEGREAFVEMVLEARAPLLAEAGAPPDDRPPLPHMTIARIQRRAKGGDRRAALDWLDTVDFAHARFRAIEVALYTWSRDRQARLFDIVERHSLRA